MAVQTAIGEVEVVVAEEEHAVDDDDDEQNTVSVPDLVVQNNLERFPFQRILRYTFLG